MKKPNIVFVFVDDMGYGDPSCYGNPMVETVCMDRLASEGVRFSNFYVNSPICSPSRVSVTTGQYPQRWRIHGHLAGREDNSKRRMADFLDLAAPTTARVLKKHGYATGHFGKWHMGGGRDVDDAPLPQEYGMDEAFVSFEGLGDRLLWDDALCKESEDLGRGAITRSPKCASTSVYVDKALDFIERHKDQPFFVRVFPNDMHDKHMPSEENLARWQGKSDSPYDVKFFAVLEEMDRQFGRLFDGIDRMGLAEDTLIVLTSDNGPTDWPYYYKAGFTPPGYTGPFYGRKWSLYEGGIRMPFIARWKGKISAGSRDDDTVMVGMDLPATFMKLAGVPQEEWPEMDGQDMSAALLGEETERAEPICWAYGMDGVMKPGNPDFLSPQLAMRDGKWKVLVNPDGSDLKLFDIVADPGETINIAESEQELARALAVKLQAWWAKMDACYE